VLVLVSAGLLHSENHNDDRAEHGYGYACPRACEAIEISCVLNRRKHSSEYNPDDRAHRKEADFPGACCVWAL
jgi:hypothetical protein